MDVNACMVPTWSGEECSKAYIWYWMVSATVFGLVQTAVKLKNKLFIRHQCRVCDSVSGKIIGNMVTDQCNKCQRKQGCNQKGNQEFCLKWGKSGRNPFMIIYFFKLSFITHNTPYMNRFDFIRYLFEDCHIIQQFCKDATQCSSAICIIKNQNEKKQ